MKTEDKNKKRLSGVLDVIRSGKKGFLIQEDTDDIEVPMEWLGGALSGDIVEVELGFKYGKTMARVIRVIERKTNSFVGEVVRGADGMFLKPDNTRVYLPIRIVGAEGASVGNKVVVEVVDWEKTPVTAEIKSVLGVAGDHETEMKAIIVARGFDSDFPKAVLDEAQKLYEHAWDEEEIKRREDFRTTLTFTIDPDTAKDFDDALSLKFLEDGNYEVGVHIADVSYFVRPKSILERETYKRATSIYLVDRTIPMLPPQLSEDLCSLKPNVDRLVFSAIFTVNKNHDVIDRRFVRGIINSQKRFTYDEADVALNLNEVHGPEETKTQGLPPERSLMDHAQSEIPYQKELRHLWKLASKLRTARKRDGAVMFDVDEIKPVLNDEKKVVGFKKVIHTESHQLIEELMLLANREVAAFVSQRLGKKNRLFVYRVHDKPDVDKLDELSVFLRAIGYSLSMNQQGVSGKDLNKLLDEIKGTPEEHLIRAATVRSMAKAVYATKNIGHFGLSFDDYTHFTSPIRRYPDLMVHRMLGALISGEKVDVDPEEQARKALYSSEREVVASEAERASVKLKQVEYFATLIGQTRQGVVSGVTEWGIYIADSESGADGMVRLMTLTDDTYEYDRKKFAVIGARTKNVIRLGDPVTYTVERVNIDDRTIDFRLVTSKQ